MVIISKDQTDFIKGRYIGENTRLVYDMLQHTEQNDTPEIVSEYDQEIPQSQTADNPVALRGRAAQPSQDTRKTN